MNWQHPSMPPLLRGLGTTLVVLASVVVGVVEYQQALEQDLAEDVFENPWFQVLGVLGTLLVAMSFFVEAWQKRSPPRPTSDDAP